MIGDPFGPALAAETAELDEPAALAALDDLLERALVRPGGAPRRFAFRHPVVRHAVYEAAPGGWRLGAHARAAAALERRGAGPVERAHHVEQAARRGDGAAIALLAAAARELQSPAPATAARFHAAALRLLPDGASERTAIEARLADAQAAAGDAAGARETLLGALRTAAPADRLALTVARREHGVVAGATPDARRRLQVALGELPAQASPDRIRLRLALALTALMSCDLHEARDQAADAAADARAIGDPVFEAAALAAGAVARVSDGEGAEPVEAAAAALERLAPEQLATRLPAFWMLGRSRRWLGRFERALADLERGAAIALETGRDNVRLQLTVERVATLIELGRLPDATAAAEQGLELARLAGNPPMLLWAHCALSSARLAAGDVSAALAHADGRGERHPPRLPRGRPTRVVPRRRAHRRRQPRARGRRDARLLRRPGPRRVLPVERPAAAADLAEAQLAAGDRTRPKRRSRRSGLSAAGRPPRSPRDGIAVSAVRLARESPADALRPRAAARPGSAPLALAPARLPDGRALAALGDHAQAVELLGGGRGGAPRVRRAWTLRRGGARAPAARPPCRARRGRIPRRPAAALTARERQIGTSSPPGAPTGRSRSSSCWVDAHGRGPPAQRLRQARGPLAGRAR